MRTVPIAFSRIKESNFRKLIESRSAESLRAWRMRCDVKAIVLLRNNAPQLCSDLIEVRFGVQPEQKAGVGLI